MRLYHSTDETGAQGIAAEGFARSHIHDSQNASWFYESRGNPQVASRDGWWVIVDLPDEVAAQYQYYIGDDKTKPYTGNYLIPWAVVNTYQPFVFERSHGSTHTALDNLLPDESTASRPKGIAEP